MIGGVDSHSRPRAIWMVLLAGVLLASCGGSEPPDDAPDTGSSSPSAAEPTPSPTPDTPEVEADKKTQKLATAAILRTKDFGPAWKEYSAATTPTREEWTKGCVSIAGGLPDDIGRGAVQTGPTMELKKGTAFVTSFSYVLPSAKAAQKLISAVNDDAWLDCRKKEIREFLTGQELTNLKVVVDPEKNPQIGQPGGLESETTFLYKDKKGRTTSYQTSSFYRIGRVVILVNPELGFNEEAPLKVFNDELYVALSKAYTRVHVISDKSD